MEHIFFDFFGTLVSYSPNLRDQRYEISHQTLCEAGACHDYEEFLDLWCAVSDEFEAKAAQSRQEYSMLDVGSAFLRRALGDPPSDRLTSRFVGAYLAEWNKGVHYLPGLREFLARLLRRYRLAVITNTSDSEIIHTHLRQMGVDDLFPTVVTSIEYGFRKPHAGIFKHAMDVVGARPEESIYVGDGFEPDYCGSFSAGMRPFLIDPGRKHNVGEDVRLANLFDLEGRLRFT
jgi:putative hydrolase of the HAD superfamily